MYIDKNVFEMNAAIAAGIRIGLNYSNEINTIVTMD